jgi:hypothetical protein
MRKEDAQRLAKFLRVVHHLSPGASDHLPSGKPQALVAPAILLESGNREVRRAVVTFHDQTGAPPEEIRLQLGGANSQGDIDLWKRNFRPSAQREESALELAAGALVPRVVLGEGTSQPGDPASTATAPENLLDGDHVEDSLDLCLRDRVAKLARRNDGSQVEQGSGHTRAWNAASLRPVHRLEGSIAVGVDPGGHAPTTPRRGDVDPASPILPESQERRRGAMRENRPGATSNHRRHPVAVRGEQSMPHGVDALMDRVQPASGNPLADEPNVQASLHQLPQGDDPVLPLRQLGNLEVCPSSPSLTGRFPSI